MNRMVQVANHRVRRVSEGSVNLTQNLAIVNRPIEDQSDIFGERFTAGLQRGKCDIPRPPMSLPSCLAYRDSALPGAKRSLRTAKATSLARAQPERRQR